MFKMKKMASVLMFASIAAWSMPTLAVELIQNGGFETQGVDANDVVNWSQAEEGILGGVLSETGTTTSVTGNTTVGAASGNYYGLLDNYGLANQALYQTFSVSGITTATLTFDMFVNNQNGAFQVNSAGLDHTTGGSFDANQHARVDLLNASATAFSTAPADVLQTFYIGGGSNAVNGYTSYSFDISSFLWNDGNYVLRFANVANQNSLQLGVDNVSINAVAAAVPEPETYAMLLAGLGFIGFVGRRRNKKA